MERAFPWSIAVRAFADGLLRSGDHLCVRGIFARSQRRAALGVFDCRSDLDDDLDVRFRSSVRRRRYRGWVSLRHDNRGDDLGHGGVFQQATNLARGAGKPLKAIRMVTAKNSRDFNDDEMQTL